MIIENLAENSNETENIDGARPDRAWDFTVGIAGSLSRDEEEEIEELLRGVYVGEGFTPVESAARAFAWAEISRRGDIYLARDATSGEVAGIVILGSPENPARQVAGLDEAEIQLLAVKRNHRGHGLGERLVKFCLKAAEHRGYRRAVLSTQPMMKSAQRIYAHLGFTRNPARDWSARGRSFLVYEKNL